MRFWPDACNFTSQTYANATFVAGPKLNLVIGPNGSGKSSLVRDTLGPARKPLRPLCGLLRGSLGPLRDVLSHRRSRAGLGHMFGPRGRAQAPFPCERGE